MDASSIITQVSRDDEICAFNSEKGTYRILTRCHPSPCACKLLRQMLPGFVSLHLLRYSHPRFSPRPTSLPNFTSCRSSLPSFLHYLASNFWRVSVSLLTLFFHSTTLSPLLTLRRPVRVSSVQCRVFSYFLT